MALHIVSKLSLALPAVTFQFYAQLHPTSKKIKPYSIIILAYFHCVAFINTVFDIFGKGISYSNAQ